MKMVATALLVAMAVLFLVSRLNGRAGMWEWVSAFAEAAMIGALADWFAVVAIFRHPLNLPIPRTAIIPENKDRIAENMAVFIRDNFLSKETLVSKMRTGTGAAHCLMVVFKGKGRFSGRQDGQGPGGCAGIRGRCPCGQALAQFDLPADGRAGSGRSYRTADGCVDSTITSIGHA